MSYTPNPDTLPARVCAFFERQRDEARCAAEQARRVDLLQRVRTAAASAERSAFDLGLVASAALAGVQWTDRFVLGEMWGSTAEALYKRVGSMSVGDLITLLLDIALVGDVRCEHVHAIGRPPEALLRAAKHYGVAVRLEPSSAERATA